MIMNIVITLASAALLIACTPTAIESKTLQNENILPPVIITPIEILSAEQSTTPTSVVRPNKRVCIKILDNKTNKIVEKCRDLKMHQKHEGTVIPNSNKK